MTPTVDSSGDLATGEGTTPGGPIPINPPPEQPEQEVEGSITSAPASSQG